MMHTSPDPFIVASSNSYLIIYKPPGLATAPLVKGEQYTLVSWCVTRFPEVGDVVGKKAIEGGLLHRLDTDTNGLVLFARNQAAYENLLEQQAYGRILKQYRAWCQMWDAEKTLIGPGFPPPPVQLVPPLSQPLEVASLFRPYGPGRKQVRPVVSRTQKGLTLDHGQPYKTLIRSIEREEHASTIYLLDVQIERGFRHQIRCHLAWLGFPIVGDPLYNPRYSLGPCKHLLALQAYGLEFLDPDTRQPVAYSLLL
ncbi:pseudouridine synthase [Gracilinema caldarium]|uniref:Pseudouridine synthase n=1 Tax=Gracilinema caldarium (strain ATCC 51460 / DSM 7334 / H1) TaxID=744872 RepID=F8F0L8_GRAC1|nr:RNA pseudouridine synthase [Gracilinema caldarium]AEJ19725.1 pseudouridine synthase [Gracilinema caldarium DSM 7334]